MHQYPMVRRALSGRMYSEIASYMKNAYTDSYEIQLEDPREMDLGDGARSPTAHSELVWHSYLARPNR